MATDDRSQGIEEWWAGERADVAELEGAAGEDDGDGVADAVNEVVARWGDVLSWVNGWEGGGSEGEERGEEEGWEHCEICLGSR